MQVSKWGNSLAIRIPKEIVDALELKEGDDIEIRVLGDKTLEASTDAKRRKHAFERLRSLPRLPAGWKFDREEANAR